MNKEELKEKAEHLKERLKEGVGDLKKKAEGFIDRARESARSKTDEPAKRDLLDDEDDEVMR